MSANNTDIGWNIHQRQSRNRFYKLPVAQISILELGIFRLTERTSYAGVCDDDRRALAGDPPSLQAMFFPASSSISEFIEVITVELEIAPMKSSNGELTREIPSKSAIAKLQKLISSNLGGWEISNGMRGKALNARISSCRVFQRHAKLRCSASDLTRDCSSQGVCWLMCIHQQTWIE